MSRFLFIVFLLLVGGGVGYLYFADIPAPTREVIKVLPNDAFTQ